VQMAMHPASPFIEGLTQALWPHARRKETYANGKAPGKSIHRQTYTSAVTACSQGGDLRKWRRTWQVHASADIRGFRGRALRARAGRNARHQDTRGRDGGTVDTTGG